MTKEEFIKRLKELGWDDEYINNSLKVIEKAKKSGVLLDYDNHCFIEAPILGYGPKKNI